MPLPKRRKSDQIDHDCRFEDYIIDMHGDIKEVVFQVKTINGTLKQTASIADKNKGRLERHSIYWGIFIFIITIAGTAYIKSIF